MSFYTHFPKQLIKDLDNTLGPDWRRTVKKVSLPTQFALADIEKIEANLRLLIPLTTCLKVAGLGQTSIDLVYRYKDKQPYKYIFERFDKATAEGEAAAITKLNSNDLTMKEAARIQWMLERCLDDKYSPRTKTTKVVTESKSVTVNMKLPQNNVLKPQPLQLVQAIDADIVKDLEVIEN
jgi:hypothetical protein